MTGKNPLRPTRELISRPGDVLEYDRALWRIHRTQGTHRQRWDQLRDFGPLRSMRWDPHPEPARTQPDWAVCYASPDVETAFAEVFQATRAIHLSAARALVGWLPSRKLHLLDLTGQWLLRNGASSWLAGGRKDACRNRSHAIRSTWPDLDGLYVPSSMNGEPSVVLYAPARDAFPADPQVARPLNSPALAGTIRHAAAALQWPIR
ncbi:RES domain-containing protein [Flexivirga oryzae]|uniref:RES domain-containing protein n=1 Tax=Flexivirga oryzae TaxID=1794944 RepID=A0A839N5L8_9MICO|nr:hypothetical protein [Flexivirga oryzae]